MGKDEGCGAEVLALGFVVGDVFTMIHTCGGCGRLLGING